MVEAARDTGNRDEWRDRVEQIALQGESLERQMQHQGATGDLLTQLGDAIDVMRELWSQLGGSDV